MSKEEAAALGYEVVKASSCEVGLLKNGKGIRTWWLTTFQEPSRKLVLPPLDHPKVMAAIEVNERRIL